MGASDTISYSDFNILVMFGSYWGNHHGGITALEAEVVIFRCGQKSVDLGGQNSLPRALNIFHMRLFNEKSVT